MTSEAWLRRVALGIMDLVQASKHLKLDAGTARSIAHAEVCALFTGDREHLVGAKGQPGSLRERARLRTLEDEASST